MNPRMAADFEGGFLALRAEFGVPLAIAGAEITAIVAESPFAKELREGGIATEASVDAKILLADLSELPAHGTPAEYKGEPFKISRITIQPGGLIGEYELVPRRR